MLREYPCCFCCPLHRLYIFVAAFYCWDLLYYTRIGRNSSFLRGKVIIRKHEKTHQYEKKGKWVKIPGSFAQQIIPCGGARSERKGFQQMENAFICMRKRMEKLVYKMCRRKPMRIGFLPTPGTELIRVLEAFLTIEAYSAMHMLRFGK